MDLENELREQAEADTQATAAAPAVAVESTEGDRPDDSAPGVQIEAGVEVRIPNARERDRQETQQRRTNTQQIVENGRQAGQPRKPAEGMFKTEQPAGRARNRNRVALCKSWVDVFNQECHAQASNPQKRQSATNGLLSVFTSLDTLNRLDTKEVLQHMTEVMASSNTGAFGRRIIFSNLKFLPESKRELMHRMLELMTQYAELSDRTKIRLKSDPAFALSMYSDVETRSNLDAFFPALK